MRKNWMDSSQNPSPDGWMEIDIDDPGDTQQSLLMYVDHTKIILAKSKQIRGYPILVIECLHIHESIIMVIQKNRQRIIQNDSQLIVNFTNDQTSMLNAIINLVEDFRLKTLEQDMEINFAICTGVFMKEHVLVNMPTPVT